MCEYSLEDVPNRPAVVGDQLVTQQIGEFNSIALVDPAKPDCAVCVPHGSKVIISGMLPSPSDQPTVSTVVTGTLERKVIGDRAYDTVVGPEIEGQYVFLNDFETDVVFTIESIPAAVAADIGAGELMPA